MNNFVKLNFNVVLSQINYGKLINSHKSKTASLNYYELDSTTKEFLISALRIKINPLRICYAEISGYGFIGAHIDYGAKTALNYYIRGANAKTIFYKSKTLQTKNIYYLNEISETEHFIANDSEYYLLNVSNIHNVVFNKPGIRSFITWQWDESYETVLQSLF